MVRLPRLVIAAPASGHGKTTVATGIMAALRRRGLVVSGHKVGPDYIDPGYHRLATGRPGRNLDPFLVGAERLVPLLLHGAEDADIAVVEGVMGLYDGQLGGSGFASTAHVAAATGSPVVLVVDISHASRSIAAVVHGMRTFDPRVRIAGVVLNKAGSDRHAGEVLDALAPAGLPALGVLHRDDGIVAPSRHLGLVPVAERPSAQAALDVLADRIEAGLDLDRLLALAAEADDLDATPWEPSTEVAAPPQVPRPTVAVAGGRAFTFRYAETEELLRAAGCDIAVFDPLHDEELPPGTRALYLGGGFPEVHAGELSRNHRLRKELLEAVAAGVPTVAECAGLLYLCRTLDGRPMVGALAADATMTPRLTLGYRTAVVPDDQLAGPAETRVRGHEFHRTLVTPEHGDPAAYLVDQGSHGFGSASLTASYLHVHWAGHPQLAERFAAAARAFDRGAAAPAPPPLPTAPPVVPLLHHGDRELAAGLADFAVNVHPAGPPGWLLEAIGSSLTQATAYPDSDAAEAAVAARHGRDRDEVLATAGATEAFTLIARARPWRRPVVVHPQFTEPEAALIAAGHDPDRVICRAEQDFALPVGEVPDDADLVVVGNPTNPTAVLHPDQVLRSLLRPGRTVVVDEAFLDTVPGEPESLASTAAPGLLVVRSLTKLWSIPGIRAGYVLGDPGLVADLRRQQPPWSVSGPATAAITAVVTPRGAEEQRNRAAQLARDRTRLAAGLDRLGVRHVPGAGAFVLARVPPGTHALLRKRGFAVRRCDTFPGLGDGWIRVAVRPPAQTEPLLAALAEVVALADVAEAAPTSRAAARPEPARVRPLGDVVLVGAGPGDPELMTLGGRAALARADVVLCDRLVPPQALGWTRPDAELLDVAKLPGGPATPQDEINRVLIEQARAGRRVVRLKGGDSFVFGRGGEELLACAEAGVCVRVIPGVTSSVSVPALAGIPVTHRGLSQGFAVVSGHVPPGHPDSTIDYRALAAAGTTIVVLMGVRTLPAIASALTGAGLDPATPAAVVADGGLPSQRIVTGTVASIGADANAAGVRPPAVTVIGAVAGLGPSADPKRGPDD